MKALFQNQNLTIYQQNVFKKKSWSNSLFSDTSVEETVQIKSLSQQNVKKKKGDERVRGKRSKNSKKKEGYLKTSI